LGIRYGAGALRIRPEYLVLVTVLLYVKIAAFRHTCIPICSSVFGADMGSAISDSNELVFNISCVGYSPEFAISY
jgi:hypothetical protein